MKQETISRLAAPRSRPRDPEWIAHPDGLSFGEGASELLVATKTMLVARRNDLHVLGVVEGSGDGYPFDDYALVRLDGAGAMPPTFYLLNASGCLCCGAQYERDWSIAGGEVRGSGGGFEPLMMGSLDEVRARLEASTFDRRTVGLTLHDRYEDIVALLDGAAS